MDTPIPDPLSDLAWQRLLAREDGAESAVYGPLLRTPPSGLVLGRIAQSLDGRIATANGASFWISGKQDLLHSHRLRALFDAVVVGAGTVHADDPLLTTRHCAGPSPVRVVIDPDRRLGAQFRVFRSAPPTLLVCADDVEGSATVGTAEVVRIPRTPDGLDCHAIIAALAGRGLRRVFIEGGGVTVSRFLAAGALDRLHVTVAPLLLGAGISSFTLPHVQRPDDGMRLDWATHRLGEDILFDIVLQRARR